MTFKYLIKTFYIHITFFMINQTRNSVKKIKITTIKKLGQSLLIPVFIIISLLALYSVGLRVCRSRHLRLYLISNNFLYQTQQDDAF